MKDTGIEWIGTIPDSWHLDRLQWHLDEIKESNNPVKTQQVLSLTNKLGVIPYEEKGEQGNKSKENVDEYKLAYPDTIVANSMNILIGSVGKCNYFGCVSPVYYVFKPKNGENIDFLNYIFQLTQFQKELRKYANGILEIRLRVSSNDILKRQIAFPSEKEQQRIVTFLDEKTAKIDQLIEIENKQIEKLKEYKQAVITEAVTKGLDKSAPMKDSGVEWIGKIPEEWNIIQTKFLFEIITGSTPDSGDTNNWDGDIKWITPADFKTENVYVEKGKRNISLVGLKSCSTTVIPKDNIIFSKRAPIGLVAININDLCTNQGCLSCVKKGNFSTKYFYYQMSVMTEFFELFGSGTTFKEISAQKFGSFKLIFPDVQAQFNIVAYLDKKCAEIDSLIAIKQKKIDMLNEYKKSLIYEYVTGKKEVV